MEYLKRAARFLAGTIIVAKYIINYRRNRKEGIEHQRIVALLRLNKDIMKVEDPGRTGIRFIKHPKSKKLTANGKILWSVRADGVMMVQLDSKQFIVPLNENGQFNYYFHEKGHLENKDNGHFEKETTCGHNMHNCLQRELEAELYVIKISKKIGKKLEKVYWSANLLSTQKQCKKCLKILNQGKCPQEERERIKKYLKIIAQSIEK